MKSNQEKKLLRKIRFLIILFIIGLILSGITAFPIETQLSIAVKHLSLFPEFLGNWLNTVYIAVKSTNVNFPFISYGTDWLGLLLHISLLLLPLLAL
jgi:hypothetical protein